MKRTFIAADVFPGPEMKKTFEKVRNLLLSERISWVNHVQMHVTIHYLGDTDEKTIPDLIEKLSPVIINIKSFQFQIQGIGVFNRNDPKVIWMGCVIPDLMSQLQGVVKSTLADFGYKAEDRPFRPHITLGRIKGKVDPVNLQHMLHTFGNMKFQTQQVKELVFYESRLTPTGALYSPFHRFSLGRG